MAARGGGAPAPASRARRRPRRHPRAAPRQIRELAGEFTAHTVDDLGCALATATLTRPLYRYESTGSDLIEGAVFAFVSDAGTDPEIILVLEAVKDGGKAFWQYRTVRSVDLQPVCAV